MFQGLTLPAKAQHTWIMAGQGRAQLGKKYFSTSTVLKQISSYYYNNASIKKEPSAPVQVTHCRMLKENSYNWNALKNIYIYI